MVFVDPKETAAVRHVAEARRLVDARAYDAAVDACLEAVRLMPAELDYHEQLYEIALRRKVAGGKPASLRERLRLIWGNPLERILHALHLWARDPLRSTRRRDVLMCVERIDAVIGDRRRSQLAAWYAKQFDDVGF